MSVSICTPCLHQNLARRDHCQSIASEINGGVCEEFCEGLFEEENLLDQEEVFSLFSLYDR